MDNNEDVIYDIINTLDNFVSNETGHINLSVNQQNIDTKVFETTNTSSCALGDLACQIPTLFEGVEN